MHVATPPAPYALALTNALLAATLALVSCAGARPRAEPPGAAEPGSAPASGAEEPHETSPAAQGESSSAAPDLPSKLPATKLEGFDLHSWAYDRQLELDLVADDCRLAELGDKPADVIWCDHRKELPQGVVLHTRALYTARAKRLIKLLELPVAASTIDVVDEPGSKGDPMRIELTLVRGSDGMTIELGESKGYDCEKARADNDANAPVTPALSRELGNAIKKVCQQRGTWVWRGGTLQHKR